MINIILYVILSINTQRPVVQQPEPEVVLDNITQFSLAPGWLLAHEDEEFANMQVDDVFIVGYEHGIAYYVVVDVRDYYAVEPDNPRTEYVYKGGRYTAEEVVEHNSGYFVLQTCVGTRRRFVLAREAGMKYGDVLAKLARGETLSVAERSFLQMQGNTMQATNAVMESWMQPGGNLDANLFAQFSSGFTMLPHECAMLYQSGDFSVASGYNTPVTTYDSSSGATLSDGLKIDPDNGRIYVTGIARDTWVLIYGWGTFEANNGGDYRNIQLFADDGSNAISMLSPVQNQVTYLSRVHLRSVPSTQTYYYMKVAQDSGVDLDFSAYGLAVCRLR